MAMVVCPWHSYKISLKTGECYYLDLNYKMKSKGKKQRTHKIIIKENKVYVEIDEQNSYECDRYDKNSEIQKRFFEKKL
jgi:hypothetical protein